MAENMARKRYVKDLEDLRINFLLMLKEARLIFLSSFEALKHQDQKQARRLIDTKRLFVKWEEETEIKCFRLVSLQSPVAGDLRLILGILKSATDIKRIANTAQRIAKIASNYKLEKEAIKEISKMSKILIRMFDITISSFENINGTDKQDLKQLQDVLIKEDNDVDNLFKAAVERYVIMLKEIDSQKLAKQFADLLILSRHMERLGDHINNIAEKIIYIETGNHVSIY